MAAQAVVALFRRATDALTVRVSDLFD